VTKQTLATHMKAPIVTIRRTGTVNTPGLVAIFTKGSSREMKERATVRCTGSMEVHIKESG
jgi:hypothetical protein